MTTSELTFGVNRRWAHFFIAALVVTNAMLAFMFSVGCALIFQKGSTGGLFTAVFLMLFCLVFFAIMTAFAETLIRTVNAGGPALTISDQGVRYRFASEELIPWSEIKHANRFTGGFATKGGVRLEISPDFAQRLSWRGAIINSYRPTAVNVSFCFVDAAATEILQAFRQYHFEVDIPTTLSG